MIECDTWLKILRQVVLVRGSTEFKPRVLRPGTIVFCTFSKYPKWARVRLIDGTVGDVHKDYLRPLTPLETLAMADGDGLAPTE